MDKNLANLAACKDHDPNLWFSTSKKAEAHAEAIAICAGCPIRTACLAYSLEWAEDGVWGGHTAAERKVMRREQGVTLR